MKRPSFLEGALLALIAAVAASVLRAVLVLLTPLHPSTSLGLIVVVLGFGYLLYLLGRTPHPVGRVVASLVWLLVTALSWALSPAPMVLVLAQLGVLWLVRALYFQGSALAALADLGLALGGLAASLWAAWHTGSLLLSVWCLFLIQALFTSIHSDVRRADTGPDPFAEAHRAAESALARLEPQRF